MCSTCTCTAGSHLKSYIVLEWENTLKSRFNAEKSKRWLLEEPVVEVIVEG